MPDQPCRNTHKRIQDCPDRTEHVRWRRPRRAYELRIERTSLYGRGAADGCGDEADCKPGNESDDLLVYRQSSTHVVLSNALLSACRVNAVRLTRAPRRLQHAF